MLPFLEGVKGYGWRGFAPSVFFSFSGLTFVQTGVIVWHSFCGKPACGARGGRWSLMGSPVFFCRTSNSFTLFRGFHGVFRKNSQIPKGYRETGYIWANFDFREMVWEFGNYSRKREFFKDFWACFAFLNSSRKSFPIPNNSRRIHVFQIGNFSMKNTLWEWFPGIIRPDDKLGLFWYPFARWSRWCFRSLWGSR